MCFKCKTCDIFLFLTLVLYIDFSSCEADYDIGSGNGSLPEEEYYTFIRKSMGEIPSCAVEAGLDMYDKVLYAGRASYRNDVIPAKVAPSLRGAFVPFDGSERYILDYEVFCASSDGVTWIHSYNGDVPPDAIIFGETYTGEKLYMGRALHEGYLIPGKVQPSHHVLYIPFDGREYFYKEYEVLVRIS